MENNIEIPEGFNEIERFLQDEMSSAERQMFIEKMEHDNKLRANVEELKLLLIGIKETALQQDLDRIHKESASPKVKQMYFSRWLVAASALLIISLTTWFVVGRESANSKLYAAYFEPDPGIISEMGNSDNYIFDRGMVDYKTGNYNAAIKSWQKLERSNSSDTLNYFMASAFLSAKETSKAISYFEKVIAHGEGSFKKDAYWYLGLAFLKEGRAEEAAKNIELSEHVGKKELLDKIKQLNE